MAVFNPQIQPSQDPNWLNTSRPISDITPDKSAAIAINTGAQVLDSSVKAADTLTKESIQKDVYQGVDTLRDAYTDSLQTMRNLQIASTDQSNPSLLPNDGTTPPPAGLQNGLDRVKQIGTALAQNGSKINDTLYTGALNAVAKQIRSAYPGYRDYIDEQIKSVSGVDPANAFMKNLMEDINRNQEANKTEMNATMSTLRGQAEAGFHDKFGVTAAQVMDGVRSGQLTPSQGMNWLNKAKSLDYDLKQKAAARADRQADDADAATNAAKELSMDTGKIMDQGWSTMRIGKGTDTAEGLIKFINENQGNTQIRDEQSMIVGQKLQGLRNQMFQAAWQHAQEGGPNSLIAKMGGDAEKVKAVINGRLANMDLAIQSVFNKDWGSAYSHMRYNEATVADQTNLLYNAPDEETRIYNRNAAAISKISPQFGSEFFKSSLLGNVPQGEKELLKSEEMKMLVQPFGESSLVSAQDVMNNLRNRGATSPKTFDEFTKSVNYLTDPKLDMSQKINFARAFFDPVKNAGLLSDKNFQKDQTVVSNGVRREVPGKFYVFNRMSTPDVANSIAKIGQQRPDIAQNYADMMSREFGEQLFSREIRDLGAGNQDYTGHSAYKIGYVNQPGQVPRFVVLRPDNTEMTMSEAAAVRAPIGSVNRLNGSIAGLRNVYTAAGSKDPNTDILNTMYKYGYQEAKTSNLDKGWTGDVTDVPRMFWQSLVNSQKDRLRKAGEMMQRNQ